MNFKRFLIITFIVCIIFSISCVNASDVNNTDNCTVDGVNSDLEPLTDNVHRIYVDDSVGDDANDGSSWQSSVKSLNRALELSRDSGTIYIADGTYNGLDNTAITLSKSVNIIGSANTTFDASNSNFIFNVTDGVKISFTNIKFVNAFKKSTYWQGASMYGGALEINDATVLIDGCSFIDNIVSFESSINRFNYGGAISNLGDLTILDSYFDSNIATSTSGLFSYGGAIYNRGKLRINSSVFNNSKTWDFGYGGAVYNDGDMLVDNSVFTNSFSQQESRGSAIYNNGNCTLLNSIIENNTISKANFYYIYGTVYNAGNLIATGNVFRNNSGIYQAPNPEYRGSGNIYSVGNLNLTYNMFIDNAPFNGIATDVYFNGGKVISLDNNWWGTNDNPYDSKHINVDDKIDSWLIFNLIPEYSALDIGDSVIITAFWSSNSPLPIDMALIPVLNVTFATQIGDELITSDVPLNEGSAVFNFTYSQNKGSYDVKASIGHFEQAVMVDVGKIVSHIKFNVTDNIIYTDNLILDVEVTGDDSNVPTGNVSVKIGKTTYVINLTDGKGRLNISKITPDTYRLKIVYEGNDDYFKAYGYANVTVEKAPTILNVTIDDIKIDQKGVAVVTLGPAGISGQAILYINGVRKKILYLYNGETRVSLNNFAEGEYNVTLEFMGNSYYGPSSANATFKVTKYETSITINVTDIKKGETQIISIITTPGDLAGPATLFINGVNSTIFLEGGITNVTVSNLEPGSYDVSVLYAENSKYYASNASASFRVLKIPTSISVDITEDGLNATIVVKTNYTSCSGIAGVYVNFRHYTLYLNKGVANFKVTLDKGTNYIFVYYEGDDDYDDATWNTTLGIDDEFIFIGQNATAFEHNDFNYTVRLIEPNGIPMPQRSVTVTLENQNYTIKTNDEGIAYLPLNLAEGTYDITATYKNQTIANNLIVKKIEFNVTVSDTFYGLNETIRVDFDKNLTGKANLFISDNLNVTVDIINGSATYNISTLKVGSYEVVVKYVNEYFSSATKSGQFNINKADPKIILDVNDIVYGTEGTITVNLPDDATGSVLFQIDNNKFTRDIIGGKSQITLTNMEKGIHNVKIQYSGDSNYNAAFANSTFSVKDEYSDLKLLINDSRYGEEIKVIAMLNQNATGSVVFNISNTLKTVEIVNGIASCTFSGFNVGEYVLNARYLGDSVYISTKNSTSFNVLKANSTIDVYVNGVYLNENIRIYAKLSPNATGTVSFSMIDYYTPRSRAISDSMASWYISPLPTGNYTVIVTYAGDKNYLESNATYILQVTQRKSILTVDIPDAGPNDRVSVSIKLITNGNDPITGLVNLTVGTTNYKINVNNGRATLVLGKMAPGTYDYSAIYEGSDEYSKASASGSFRVADALLNLTLAVNNITAFYGSSKNLVITVRDDRKQPVSGIEVMIKINGETYSYVSDVDGHVSVPIKSLDVGKYVAEIMSEETSRYASASASAKVEIITTVEAIDVVKVFGSAAQYYAIFTDSNGKALANTEIKLTVGSNSYTVKTLPNGIIRVNINFNPGRYSITATNPATGQKITTSLFIFLKIMENKNVVKYYGGSQKYTVRAYDDSGNPVGAGKIVTFKVNGKTYKVKTDKNGYASCKINLKPKTYTITATYGGFKVSNKIKVKPVLTAKNISKKKGKTIKFKAKLVNTEGKSLKGKKITFKFKGKKYKAKTNKKGVATLKLKMNLKVGKHKIVVKYGKSKITKKIRIK